MKIKISHKNCCYYNHLKCGETFIYYILSPDKVCSSIDYNSSNIYLKTSFTQLINKEYQYGAVNLKLEMLYLLNLTAKLKKYL